MCKFIESIRILDGKIMSLTYHQARVDKTLSSFTKHPATSNPHALIEYESDIRERKLCLSKVLDKMLPNYNGENDNICKARLIYDLSGKVLETSILPYHIRNIQSLSLVACNDIEYNFKYANRSTLNALTAKSDGADEIIIVRHGLLTDTSYSNIALFDGNTWYTPRTPLLNGTMRQQLLNKGLLQEADITPTDVTKFKKIGLINAMMPLGACCLDITQILTR